MLEFSCWYIGLLGFGPSPFVKTRLLLEEIVTEESMTAHLEEPETALLGKITQKIDVLKLENQLLKGTVAILENTTIINPSGTRGGGGGREKSCFRPTQWFLLGGLPPSNVVCPAFLFLANDVCWTFKIGKSRQMKL